MIRSLLNGPKQKPQLPKRKLDTPSSSPVMTMPKIVSITDGDGQVYREFDGKFLLDPADVDIPPGLAISVQNSVANIVNVRNLDGSYSANFQSKLAKGLVPGLDKMDQAAALLAGPPDLEPMSDGSLADGELDQDLSQTRKKLRKRKQSKADLAEGSDEDSPPPVRRSPRLTRSKPRASDHSHQASSIPNASFSKPKGLSSASSTDYGTEGAPDERDELGSMLSSSEDNQTAMEKTLTSIKSPSLSESTSGGQDEKPQLYRRDSIDEFLSEISTPERSPRDSKEDSFSLRLSSSPSDHPEHGPDSTRESIEDGDITLTESNNWPSYDPLEGTSTSYPQAPMVQVETSILDQVLDAPSDDPDVS